MLSSPHSLRRWRPAWSSVARLSSVLAASLLALFFTGTLRAQEPAPLPAVPETAGSEATASVPLTSSLPLTAGLLLTDTLQGIAVDENATPSPTLHVVREGDTLFLIGEAYSVTLDSLVAANRVVDPNRIEVGQVLIVPGRQPAGATLPLPPVQSPVISPTLSTTATAAAGDVYGRLNQAGRSASITSPFYRTTWLTYYGRPKVFVMGILGEHDVATLTSLLKEKAAQLDATNGSLKVKPAFHLVHGMATVVPTPEGDHLEYLSDDVVMEYIEAGLRENIAVILDVQVGGLSVSEALSPTLKFLKYPNVHLAVDPEFAMSHAGQETPGNPIGYVTGSQVNAAQELIAGYLEANGIRGRRILLVHQFFEEMIVDKAAIDLNNPRVELTFCADGYGDAGSKIWKYNHFFTGRPDVKYTAFKIFYRWDEPVLSEAQALGVDPWSDRLSIEVTPNMVIYQ